MISARKAKHFDATIMFTYFHANTPLGQSERAYYLSYYIIDNGQRPIIARVAFTSLYKPTYMILSVTSIEEFPGDGDSLL